MPPDVPSIPPASIQNSTPSTLTAPSVPANPLLEARVDSIDELFSRDPEGYTCGPDGSPISGPEMLALVAGLRRQREIWEKAEAQGAKRAPSPKASSKPKPTDLAELGLDE